LSEYCLIAAFLALAAAAVLIGVSGGIGNLWNTGSSTLTNAAQSSSGPAGHN